MTRNLKYIGWRNTSRHARNNGYQRLRQLRNVPHRLHVWRQFSCAKSVISMFYRISTTITNTAPHIGLRDPRNFQIGLQHLLLNKRRCTWLSHVLQNALKYDVLRLCYPSVIPRPYYICRYKWKFVFVLGVHVCTKATQDCVYILLFRIFYINEKKLNWNKTAPVKYAIKVGAHSSHNASFSLTY